MNERDSMTKCLSLRIGETSNKGLSEGVAPSLLFRAYNVSIEDTIV